MRHRCNCVSIRWYEGTANSAHLSESSLYLILCFFRRDRRVCVLGPAPSIPAIAFQPYARLVFLRANAQPTNAKSEMFIHAILGRELRVTATSSSHGRREAEAPRLMALRPKRPSSTCLSHISPALLQIPGQTSAPKYRERCGRWYSVAWIPPMT
jgi:hypothetical protein